MPARIATFVVCILAVLFLVVTARCQQTLPDNPVPLSAITCICQNGNFCQTGFRAKLVGSCPLDKAENDFIHVPAESPRWWTLRLDPRKPLLYTNRQTLTDPTFIASCGYAVAMEELARTRTHSESEPYAVAIGCGFTYLFHRTFGKPFDLALPIGASFGWLREWKRNKGY